MNYCIFLRSTGIRFVGDSVSQFFPGDLVLVGAYVPHLWRNDSSYYQDDSMQSKSKTIVIKFLQNFIGEDTFHNPEFLDINQLLDQSKFGVSFNSSISQKASSKN